MVQEMMLGLKRDVVYNCMCDLLCSTTTFPSLGNIWLWKINDALFESADNNMNDFTLQVHLSDAKGNQSILIEISDTGLN